MATETKVWLSTAAIVLLLAVAAGAIGSHVLPAGLEARVLRGYESAVDFQFYHGLGLVAVALVLDRAARRGFLRAAAAAFVAGILFFCGTLYARAFGVVTSTALAPYGGTALMIGWLAFAVGVWRTRRPR